ncbi:Unknown protein sequence [Pseudomonas amygdali pv. lachrymans]|nr:Unknown protein sequence [Pseudomonas amygdali pv. lachrymans]
MFFGAFNLQADCYEFGKSLLSFVGSEVMSCIRSRVLDYSRTSDFMNRPLDE